MLTKAAGRGADALILDLEDAVAPANKQSARQIVADWLEHRDDTSTPVWVRINGEAEGEDDFATLAPQDFDGVMIPKAKDADEVARWSKQVTAADLALLVLIETAGALQEVDHIAAIRGVYQLMIGEADLGAELGMTGAHPVWDSLRAEAVVASAAAGIAAPIGPVDPDFSSPERLEVETRHLYDMGFGSRAIIHPAQISPVHRAMTPSKEEVEEARRLLARHEQALASGEGAYRGDGGELVDEAFVRRARRVLATARDET